MAEHPGKITDMIEFLKAFEELHKLVEELPNEFKHRARRHLGRMGELTALDVDVETAMARWLKGMPDKAAQLTQLFQDFGWTETEEAAGY